MSGALIHIGNVPNTINTAAIDRMVRRAQESISHTAHVTLSANDLVPVLNRQLPPTYEEYLYLIENHTRARRDMRRNGHFQDLNAPMGGPLLSTLSPAFAPTPEGWIAYLARFHRKVLEVLPPPSQTMQGFPEEVRQMHTLIVAGNGSGKSTIMKTIAHHYVANTRSAVVVLDPHAELVEDMRVWPEFANSDRLIIIDAKLFSGMTVGINPLDGRGMDMERRNEAAAEFAGLFNEFTGELSRNMNTVSHYCAEVLLGIEGATVRDFMRMLNTPEKPRKGQDAPPPDERTVELMRQALNHPREGVREFFRTKFGSDHYATTRNSLHARLEHLMANMKVEAMLTGGPAKLNLADALNSGKVVLINLKSFGEREVRPVGLFFLSMITAMAYAREPIPKERRVPVHMFIDEMTKLGGADVVKVVNELRKFGVHATMAQQAGGQNFDADMKTALFESTAVKILSTTRPQQFSNVMGNEDLDDMPPLGTHEFWVKWGKMPVQVVKSDSKFAGSTWRCTPGQWADTLERLKARDYRPNYVEMPARRSPPPADAGVVTSTPIPLGPPPGAPASARPPEPAPPPPRPQAVPLDRWRKTPELPPELELD